ncbi:MAG: hypothetical protein M0Z70_11045 [Nitrospiraceae bacterium]|jgi:hypothetical protein|nr:hypothetical protein [Nitrospiraceae bacterium]
MERLLTIRQKNKSIVGKKIYFVSFEFICGEYSQHFNKSFYAEDEDDLETKIEKYLKNYYGKNNLSEVVGDVYYYHSGEVGVKYLGYAEINNFEDILSELL